MPRNLYHLYVIQNMHQRRGADGAVSPGPQLRYTHQDNTIFTLKFSSIEFSSEGRTERQNMYFDNKKLKQKFWGGPSHPHPHTSPPYSTPVPQKSYTPIQYTDISRHAAKINLESISDGMHLLFVDFGLSAHHVSRLFSVERVGDTSNNEHIDLHAASTILLIAFWPIVVTETRVCTVAAG